VDNAVIVPAAIGCLASGLLLSWLTPWGFFKHRWISVKWVLTVTCIAIGIVVLGPPVESQPVLSRTLGLGALDEAVYAANRTGTLVGGAALILTLLFMLVISVLKPWQKNKKAAAAGD
jgi:hypothetical protein